MRDVRARSHRRGRSAALVGAAVAAASVLALSGCAGARVVDRAETAPTTATPTATPSATPSAAGAGAAPRTTALFFGDSYVVGGPYADAERSMAALAARRLGWDAQLRGGGGTGFTAANPEYDLGTYLQQVRAGAVDVGPVDWVVVEGGGNDRQADPALITRRTVRTVQAVARRHPEARLVLMAGFDPTVDDFRDYDGVTRAMRRAAQRLDVAFIDAQYWLQGRPELVGPDFDHPTAAGNVVLGARLAAALRALGA